MTRLGTVISEAILHHYGRDELLRRLAHPFWFQSFGAVMPLTSTAESLLNAPAMVYPWPFLQPQEVDLP
jgi:Protein of unknown function (DUF763)